MTIEVRWALPSLSSTFNFDVAAIADLSIIYSGTFFTILWPSWSNTRSAEISKVAVKMSGQITSVFMFSVARCLLDKEFNYKLLQCGAPMKYGNFEY